MGKVLVFLDPITLNTCTSDLQCGDFFDAVSYKAIRSIPVKAGLLTTGKPT